LSVELRVSRVGHRYGADGERIAVADVSFDARPGELVCIVGPSGCGKSTFLKIVNGLFPSTAGTIEIRQPDGGKPAHAMVFQDSSLFPWYTVIDNAAYGLVCRGMPKAQARAKAKPFVDLVSLNGFEEKFPYQLSGGMQQRANLARALTVDPEILLMDEPFGPLDAQTRQIMGNLLLDLWAGDRKAVMFVTHDLEEAIALADRVAVMSVGPAARIIGDFRVDLPRPRDIAEVRLEPAFHHIHKEIWSQLRVEVQKAYAQGEGGSA
jgi:NitT/TauT family transport system ATP-binding protein